ncbi:putative SWI/SNF-related matrix-associated actin-dependent regulator of chromatin [Paramyrothecium foliicola]|nr:putative SWI/SNF-related matrix-associated actin-dependent regulator of chromatin [Paramyrothecium foliicola]
MFNCTNHLCIHNQPVNINKEPWAFDMSEPDYREFKRRRLDGTTVPSSEPVPVNGLSTHAESALPDNYLSSYYNASGHFREIRPLVPASNAPPTVPVSGLHAWEYNALDAVGTIPLDWSQCINELHPYMDFTQNAVDEAGVLSNTASHEDSNEGVCFGTILEVPGRCESKGLMSLPPRFPVTLGHLDSGGAFGSIDKPSVVGHISGSHSHITQGLLQESALKLYASCKVDEDVHIGGPSHASVLVPCVLDITLYGPFELFEDIGQWCQNEEVYLQDPAETHLDQSINHTNFLDSLATDINLDEAPQPSNVQTTLQRHQKQALTFMLYREQGWSPGAQRPEIWQSTDTQDGRLFINTISGSYQREAPTQFYGGIIADPMGLGKTLSMISLIAHDKASGWLNNLTDTDSSDRLAVSATLVIVPPPLLGTWDQQFTEHVFKDELRIFRHHSKSKLSNFKHLSSVDVVLTTYHTVSSDWKNSTSSKSLLYSVQWRRIILDEGKWWAVTGTPIQNRLGDLTTLLTFIRAHPYDNPKAFEADISALWKSGNDAEAVQRLQRLSACLLLRRPKTTITLPARHDTRCPVFFSNKERAAYDQMKNQVVQRLDDILDGAGSSGAVGYVNALQQIESLRLFCNLGLLYQSRDGRGHQLPSEVHNWADAAQHAFDTQRAMLPIQCISCATVLDLNDTLLDDSTLSNTQAWFSKCSRFLCCACTQSLQRSRLAMACGHAPPCPAAAVSTSSDILEEVPDLNIGHAQNRNAKYSSKVEALVARLRALPSGLKCVVFSSWRSTLDVVEKALNDISMKCTRLTLTSASHAYLIEPHWNPTVEEQALARIHRIGQVREVTTVRFYMQDSFEEVVTFLSYTPQNNAHFF